MKKGIPLLILLLIILGVSFAFQKAKGKIGGDFTGNLPQVAVPQQSVTPPSKVTTRTKSIFVPYWSVTGEEIDTTGYDSVIYFGIAASKEGIDEKDQGFRRLKTFTENVSSSRTFLTLRMIDRETTLAILKDKKAQEAVVAQTLSLAKEHGFTGVVLDLELSALPFDSLIKQITTFTTGFSEEAKRSDLQFVMTVYGDTYYRIRPFDIATLAKHVDSFLVMAYDFHKAGGNPGPNFPLNGKTTYGYDFETMLSHFLAYVPAERLGIIYGMFGYDWIVDEEGKVQGPGEAKSLLVIRNSIIAKCEVLLCQMHRDTKSSEMTITYTSIDGKKHVVWYEDEVSVKKKEELAGRLGVGTSSFWAYSFF